MNEFELINHFFKKPCRNCLMGIGDDAAVISSSPNTLTHVAMDTLVAGQHFFEDILPAHLGHKVLAVNLSDIAAMGATPRWALLSLTIPKINQAWLSEFAKGLFALAEIFALDIVGGDTVRGPLAITMTVLGETPKEYFLSRHGAKPNQDIWVSGQLGLSALALYHQTHVNEMADHPIPLPLLAKSQTKLNQPAPRIFLGQALHNIASACIDISDGLLADLTHLLEASGCGATLSLKALPSDPWIKKNPIFLQQCLLGGGEDYELLFTADIAHRKRINQLAKRLGLPISRIGSTVESLGLSVLDSHQQPIPFFYRGFDHFANT